MTSNLPNDTAAQFRLLRTQNSTRYWFVAWFQRDNNGVLVEVTDANRYRAKAEAQRRLQQLQRKRDKLVPYVRWCPSRRLYMLHANGKRHSLGTRDPELIDHHKARVMRKLGLDGADSDSYTVAQMLSDYHSLHIAPNAAPTTQRQMPGIIARLRSWFTDDKQVRHVTMADLQSYRDDRLVQAGLATAYRVEAATWNAALRFAQRRRMLPKGMDLPLMELPQRTAKQYLVLSKDDWAAILAVAEQERRERFTRLSALELYLHMVRYTGGRISFYADLRWDRVDLSAGMIHFQPVGAQETKKRRPTVPIAADLLPVLQRAYDERQPGDDFVLWQRQDMQHQIKRLRQAMADSGNPRMQELAPQIHSHAFRRSYVTWAVSEGVSPWLVGQVTGQSTAVIEQYYAVYRPDMGRSVVDSV